MMSRRRFCACAAALVGGCKDRELDPLQPLGGYKYVTPLGFEVWWTMPGFEDSATPEIAVASVDALARAWEAKGKWSDGRPRDIRSARLYPIQLIPAQRIASDGSLGWEHAAALTYYGHHILLATLSDRWDGWLKAQWRGLSWLIHEWDHAQFGEWHA